jgi:hypothetical protein
MITHMLADYELECHYWVHWELFPGTRQVPDALIKEVTGILVHAGYGMCRMHWYRLSLTFHFSDTISSTASTAPFSNTEIQDHLSYLKHLRGMSAFANVKPIISNCAGMDGTGGYAPCVVGK